MGGWRANGTESLPPALARGVPEGRGEYARRGYYDILLSEGTASFLPVSVESYKGLPPPQCAHWGTPLINEGGQGRAAPAPHFQFVGSPTNHTSFFMEPTCHTFSLKSSRECGMISVIAGTPQESE